MQFQKAQRKRAKLRLALLPAMMFGNLTIQKRAPDKGLRPAWTCSCSCGNFRVVREQHLRSGHTTSCGCRRAKSRTVHGHRKVGVRSPTYNSWQAMHQRCSDPSRDNYHLYGGRGIKVCERWGSFDLFLEDMGSRPYATSIDRRNSNGNYEPDNCFWASDNQQANNKRSNIVISHNGESRTLAEWCQATGISYGCAYTRIRRQGWNPIAAITTMAGAMPCNS